MLDTTKGYWRATNPQLSIEIKKKVQGKDAIKETLKLMKFRTPSSGNSAVFHSQVELVWIALCLEPFLTLWLKRTSKTRLDNQLEGGK